MNFTGNINIIKTDINTDKEWNSFLHTNYNIFFDPVFLRYNDEFSKGITWHHTLLKASTKNKVLGVITGCETYKNGEKKFISSCGASFGGFLWREKLTVVDYIDCIGSFIKYLKVNNFTYCTINNPPCIYNAECNEEYEYALLDNGFRITKDSITNIINLRVFEYTKLSNPLKRTIRNSSKTLIVETSEFKGNDNHFEKFYQILYKNRMAKNIKPTHTKDELYYLYKNLHGKIILFTASVENNICGICVLFIIKSDTVLNFYLATDEYYKKYRVADYLLFKTIEWSKKNNFRIYDIGTSDVGGSLIVGLFHFKKKFKADGFLRKTFSISI